MVVVDRRARLPRDGGANLVLATSYRKILVPSIIRNEIGFASSLKV